tara:strand:+ start:2876 stop:6373 length:3498 start_codon:yes stop_codon:yes gene_type:complete
MAYNPETDELSRGPAVLDRGESSTYIEDGRLIKETNVDGIIYRNKSTSDESGDINDTFDAFDFTDESIGGANFTIGIGDNAIFVEDDSSNIRAIFGQITQGSYGLQTLDQSGNELFGIYGSTANLAGWTVNQNYLGRTVNNKTISLIADDEPRLNIALASSTLLKAGYIDGSSVGLQVFDSDGFEVIRIDDTGTTKIAGWLFTDTIFKSAPVNSARIELDSVQNRVSVINSGNDTKTAMGYLGGLVKNNSIGHQIASVQGSGSTAVMVLTGITSDEHEDAFNPGTLEGLQYFIAASNGAISGSSPGLVTANTYNTITVTATGANAAISAAHSAGLEYFVLKFATDDYGFWAAQGDKMRIDGNVEYDSGDWLIHSDGALKFSTGDGSEVMRLGTHAGNRGLFIGSDLGSSTAPLAQYTGSKILIGDEAGEHLKYTTSGGLVVSGTVTVTNPGDTSTTAREDFKAATLDTGVWTIVGNTTQVSTPTGIGFMDNVETSTWDSGIRWSDAFKREHAPSFYWDFEILGVGVENNFEFIGWWLNKTDMSYLRMLYGIYVSNDDIMWRYGADSAGSPGDFGAYKTEYIGAANSLVVGVNWRLVIQIRTGGGAFGYIYKNGDYTTPFSTYTWITGTQTEMYLGSDYAHGETDGDIPKVEHQNLTAGNLQPAVSTQISGGLIKTGKIESTDGNTFFDLNNNIIQMDDNASSTRLTLGNHSGTNYALRIARPGIDLTPTTTSDDMIFSSDWAIPKYAPLFGSSPHNRAGSESFIDEVEFESRTMTEDGVAGSGTTSIYSQKDPKYYGVINSSAGMSSNSSSGGYSSASTFTDTTRSNFNNNAWKTDELVGMYIINHRQGANNSYMYSINSYAKITGNTTTSITTTTLTNGVSGGYNNNSAGANLWNYWSADGGGGDNFSIVHHHFGQLSTTSNSLHGYYVGKRRIQSSYSFLHEPGVTCVVVPYLHDKNNKYIRFSAFLTEKTVARVGIYKASFGTTTVPQIELTPSGLRAITGNNGIWVDQQADLTDLNGGNNGTIAVGQWFMLKESGGHYSYRYVKDGSNSTLSWAQVWAAGITSTTFRNHFDYLHLSGLQGQATTSTNEGYKVITMNLEGNDHSGEELEHGEEYIVKITGGRVDSTQYDSTHATYAGRHRIIMPKLTVHGYDFNATGGSNST